jgi:two-component system OmpR family response regulator
MEIAGASNCHIEELEGESTRPAAESSLNGSGSQSRECSVSKILIVEDNRSFCEALSTNLQAHFPNLTVTTVARVQQARAKVQSMQPDLIFVDMRLPDGNGLVFTGCLRAGGNKSVIIILSSHDLPEYRDAALSSGADHFVAKGSMDIDDIFTLVQSIPASPF